MAIGHDCSILCIYTFIDYRPYANSYLLYQKEAMMGLALYLLGVLAIACIALYASK